MSSLWQNKGFLLSSPQKNTDSENHPEIRKSLWKSRDPEEKFQHTTGSKKSETRNTEEGKRKISLYLHNLSPKAAV